MTYDTKLPDDVVRNGNSCSSSENARLVRAMTHTLEAVKTSIGNYDETAFRRWFGVDNDRQSDWMVKTRIRNTYNFMKEKYQHTWNVVCCHNTLGSCDGCVGDTLAYVMRTNPRDGKLMSEAWMRMCPLMMK